MSGEPRWMKTMNIYSPRGTIVYFLDHNGHDNERKLAADIFKKDQKLTVRSINVGSFSSEVMFEEYVGQWFNTVMFTEEPPMSQQRTIQFKHDRIYKALKVLDGAKDNEALSAKGGRTIALEVPTVEEFKAFVPSLIEPIRIKIGIANCSKKDHYNKKLGRQISKGRMEELSGYVSLVSETEVQIIVVTTGLTVVLRKHPNTDRVYFEEVI